MALEDDITLLARQPLLSLMERDAIRLVAFSAETRTLRAGDVLFRNGEVSDGAILVVSGAVALMSQEDGQPADEIAGPGVLLSELALFSSVKRPATAIAREPTQIMRLSRSVMRRVLAEFPDSAQLIADAVAERLRGFVGALDGVRLRLDAIDRG